MRECIEASTGFGLPTLWLCVTIGYFLGAKIEEWFSKLKIGEEFNGNTEGTQGLKINKS